MSELRGIERIEHWLPMSQQQILDAEADRRAVRRATRAREKYQALRRAVYVSPADIFLVHSPALDDAIERGVKADSAEWDLLVAQEIVAAQQRSAQRRQRTAAVLERYERLRAAAHERREAEAKARRLAERQAAAEAPLEMDALLARLNMSRAFAAHLLQPYCTCEEESYDRGWDRCQHARDLGLEPWGE